MRDTDNPVSPSDEPVSINLPGRPRPIVYWVISGLIAILSLSSIVAIGAWWSEQADSRRIENRTRQEFFDSQVRTLCQRDVIDRREDRAMWVILLQERLDTDPNDKVAKHIRAVLDEQLPELECDEDHLVPRRTDDATGVVPIPEDTQPTTTGD